MLQLAGDKWSCSYKCSGAEKAGCVPDILLSSRVALKSSGVLQSALNRKTAAADEAGVRLLAVPAADAVCTQEHTHVHGLPVIPRGIYKYSISELRKCSSENLFLQLYVHIRGLHIYREKSRYFLLQSVWFGVYP